MRVLATLFFLVSYSFPAHALGRVGHETVCYIAYANLTDTVRTKVDELMASDPGLTGVETRAQAFAQSCTWADRARKNGDGRAQDHYVNVPRDTEHIESLDCPLAPRCLFTAIPADLVVLKDEEASSKDRLNALKYLGHWIGDLHQPMHISFQEDRGGNTIKVEGPMRCTNMHWLWDECVVTHAMTSMGAMSSRDLAATIVADKEIQSFLSDWLGWPEVGYETPQSVVNWADQVFQVTTLHEVNYCRLDRHPEPGQRPTCVAAEEGEVTIAPEHYLKEMDPIILSLMSLAGHRLAEVLNTELGE